MKTIEKQVVEIIADITGYREDEIKHESRLAEDLNLDSLDQVEVVTGLEEDFSIEIMDEEAEACNTVGDIVAMLVKKGVQG